MLMGPTKVGADTRGVDSFCLFPIRENEIKLYNSSEIVRE